MQTGDRIVLTATGDRGEVVDWETILGEPEDLWSEVQLTIHLDDTPEDFNFAVSERAVVLESEYDQYDEEGVEA